MCPASSDASKHVKMENAGWMGWVASFCGPASIGCAEMLDGLIFLAGVRNQQIVVKHWAFLPSGPATADCRETLGSMNVSRSQR